MPQPVPSLPRWYDLHNRARMSLDPSWTPESGIWRVAAGNVLQDDGILLATYHILTDHLPYDKRLHVPASPSHLV